MVKTYCDPCSYANVEYFRLNHVDIDWRIDFNQKKIFAQARLTFDINSANDNVKRMVLDTRDLEVTKVTDVASNSQLSFKLSDNHSAFGAALTIDVSTLNLNGNTSLSLLIEYSTSPNASALQWIDCKATCGKKYPYLFSQCQAIHARSILPVQDSPQIKFTYNATVRVEKPLVALMSACSVDSVNNDDNTISYRFEQKIKIPAYLLAIVVGDLVSKDEFGEFYEAMARTVTFTMFELFIFERDVGPVSKVWTERELIEEAAYEFAQVNEMLEDAQKVLGKYVWGRYDLLVLPPTFPYGGMENPCLTFVTPTIIARDRSLVDVVQHEITHSWTGNLVTNCSWEHFWLNEGFTRYIERVLVSRFKKSEQLRQFEFIDGVRHLKEEVQNFGENNQLTQLCINLKNVDPDDAFSSIPYEKGALFLYYLETLLGGLDVFCAYLKAHIEKFQGVSIDTNDWKAYLYEYFHDKKEILDRVDWNMWLHTPGVPSITFNFDQTLALEVENLTKKLLNENITSVDETYLRFESNQQRELLSQLFDKEALSHEKLQALNEIYKFGDTYNCELLFRWLRLGIKAKWTPIIKPALEFVNRQGRMKFTRPVYRDLFNWSEAKEQAIKNFQEQRVFMHQTTATLVAKDLGLSE